MGSLDETAGASIKNYFEDSTELSNAKGLGASKNTDGALKLINEFSRRNVQGFWPHINRARLANALRGRIANPDKINQRSTGLCGVVAMVRVWAFECPDKYVSFAIDLFEKGVGEMRGRQTHSARRIEPSSSLKNATPPPGMNAADWIVAASIRESLNLAFGYSPGEGMFQIEAFTWPWDVKKQFDALGYTHVRSAINIASPQGYESLMKASELYQSGWRVILLINMRLLTGERAGLIKTPDHYVGLNSAIVRRISSGRPELYPFELWCWGASQRVPKSGQTISLDEVTDSYFGYTAGRF